MHKSGFILFLFSCVSINGVSQSVAPAGQSASEKDYRRALVKAESQPDSALFYYERYRKAIPITDSVVSKREIDFYNYAGGIYLQRAFLKKDHQGPDYQTAITCFDKVLEHDSINHTANMNLMVAYFNKGVAHIIKGDYCKQKELIEKVDWTKPDSELPSLAQLLECVKPEEYEKYGILTPFKAALPYALRLYRMDPARKPILYALTGIYRVLGDMKQSESYEKKEQAIIQKK